MTSNQLLPLVACEMPSCSSPTHNADGTRLGGRTAPKADLDVVCAGSGKCRGCNAGAPRLGSMLDLHRVQQRSDRHGTDTWRLPNALAVVVLVFLGKQESAVFNELINRSYGGSRSRTIHGGIFSLSTLKHHLCRLLILKCCLCWLIPKHSISDQNSLNTLSD